jgi:two-component system chemotaxis sensor kinase CheA
MAAVMVDELLGAQQAVIKPLGNMFRKVPGVSGSTIIGDGSIALVLDVAGLLREAVRAEASVRVH